VSDSHLLYLFISLNIIVSIPRLYSHSDKALHADIGGLYFRFPASSRWSSLSDMKMQAKIMRGDVFLVS
jgi:hypothetical protein